MEGQIVEQRRPLDYLEDEVAEAFFSAREHEAYYLSLKTVDQQRAFHGELTASLMRLVAVAKGAGMDLIDELLRRSQPQASSSGMFARSARQSLVDPEGMRLLGVDATADFTELREAYRAAALVHHPDRGGSNEAVTAINRAYEQLHAIAGESFAPASEEALSWGRPPSAIEYRWSAMWLLFRVALDDWELAAAADWLQQLLIDLEREPASFLPWRLSNLVLPGFQLAERFTAAGCRGDAERVLTLIAPSVEAIKSTGRNYEYLLVAQRKAQAIVVGQRAPRFVINHIRQLENAYRLGAVDEKRYVNTRARLDGRAETRTAALVEQEELLSQTRFIRDLPTDASLATGKSGDRLVPEPGYFQSRAEALSKDQQREYLQSFSVSDTSLRLVQKYAWVRLSSLLRSALYGADAVDLEALREEVMVLTRLQPKCAPHGGAVANVLGRLAEISGTTARERALAKIQELLEPKTVGDGPIVMIMPSPSELSRDFLEKASAICERLALERR